MTFFYNPKASLCFFVQAREILSITIARSTIPIPAAISVRWKKDQILLNDKSKLVLSIQNSRLLDLQYFKIWSFLKLINGRVTVNISEVFFAFKPNEKKWTS